MNRWNYQVGLGLLVIVLPLLWAVPARTQIVPEEQGAVSQQVDMAQEPTAGYQNGFFLRSLDEPFELRIRGRVQARYTHEMIDGEPDEMAFSIARARLVLSGYMFTESLRYQFQADFGRGFVTLKDAYLDYNFIPDRLQLRCGQWKRPFSRQQINSSGRLELVDRAITDRFFSAGRDIGIAVHNGYEGSPTLEYALGLFNGSGEKPLLSGDVAVDTATGEGEISGGSFSNVPDRMHPALVIRLGYNHGGIKGYSEADLEGGPFRFALGASGLVDLDADEDGQSGILVEIDYTLKAYGFSSTGAVYLSSAQSGEGFADQSPDALGFHLQLGYILSRRFQPAVRYSLIDPDEPDNTLQEILGGLSVYLFGHDLKWQTDAGALLAEVPGGSRTDYLVRTQLQLAF